jgi:hypothetical protein
MSRLSTFFKDSDSEFGIFYPNHYLLSAFPNFDDAELAKKALAGSGRGAEDVISASGADVVQFAEEQLLKHGLWGVLMTQLSRAIGTEAVYADRDLAAAKKGVAFVAVHCATEDDKKKAWSILEPTHPLIARYYSGSGIEHLAGENATGEN